MGMLKIKIKLPTIAQNSFAHMDKRMVLQCLPLLSKKRWAGGRQKDRKFSLKHLPGHFKNLKIFLLKLVWTSFGMAITYHGVPMGSVLEKSLHLLLISPLRIIVS